MEIKSATAPMADRPQPEHYLAILKTIARSNWLALAAGVLVIFAIRLVDGLEWPSQGRFGLECLLVGLEFAGANLALSLALRFRGWYQRTPREGLNKLRNLTILVLAWEIIHVVGLVSTFGGLALSISALLPLCCLAAFILLPRDLAMYSGLAIGLATIGLMVGQVAGWLPTLGALGTNFLVSPEGIVLSGVLMLALIGGCLTYGRLRGATRTVGLVPSDDMFDSRFGCFSLDTLRRRSDEEACRGVAHSASTSLLVVGIANLVDDLAGPADLDRLEKRLQALAQAVKSSTRTHLDTCAYLGQGRFGVLLPTSNEEQAKRVFQRLRDKAAAILEADTVLESGVGSLDGTQVPSGGGFAALLQSATDNFGPATLA